MPDGGVEVAWFASAADLPEALWAQAFPPSIEGRWWYLALERSGLEGQFIFAYAGLRCGGEWVGIAPTFLMDLSLDLVAPDELGPIIRALRPLVPALRHQRTLFVGSPCSEEGAVGLVPSVQLAEVLPALQAALNARAKAVRAQVIAWKDMPEPLAGALRAFAPRGGLFEIPGYPGALIRNAVGGFEGFLARLPSQRRYDLKKKLKTSRAEVDLTEDVLQHPTAGVLAEIWPLFQATYEKSDLKFERLTPAFFEQMAALDVTFFILLRERDGGRLVAFMLCYWQDGLAVNKFIGLDYALGSKAYLYFRLWEAFVRWAGGRGAHSLQSGQTGYRPKLDLGHELVPLATFSRHRNPLVHRVYAQIARSVSWSTLDEVLKAHVEARARAAA